MRWEWLRYGWKELTFVESPKNLRILSAEVAYLLPRARSAPGWYTRVPRALQIEPTNHCNLNCLRCSRPRSSRAHGYMDLGFFRGIIDEAPRLGVKLVRLYGLGEPTLHPQIAGWSPRSNAGDYRFAWGPTGPSLTLRTAKRSSVPAWTAAIASFASCSAFRRA
jgi:hypothetical protein